MVQTWVNHYFLLLRIVCIHGGPLNFLECVHVNAFLLTKLLIILSDLFAYFILISLVHERVSNFHLMLPLIEQNFVMKLLLRASTVLFLCC